MRSEPAQKAFATFRVAGDLLRPDEVTSVLGVQPTHSSEKGEAYNTGRSTIVSPTGIWLFSTENMLLTNSLWTHFRLLMLVIGIEAGGIAVPSSLLKLKKLLHDKALTATISLFWHGAVNAEYPREPAGIDEFFSVIPITVERDFDRDTRPARRRQKAAA